MTPPHAVLLLDTALNCWNVLDQSINYVFIYGCHGKVYLEDHVVNVLAEEVEEEPVAHRGLLHDHLHALRLHAAVPAPHSVKLW